MGVAAGREGLGWEGGETSLSLCFFLLFVFLLFFAGAGVCGMIRFLSKCHHNIYLQLYTVAQSDTAELIIMQFSVP